MSLQRAIDTASPKDEKKRLADAKDGKQQLSDALTGTDTTSWLVLGTKLTGSYKRKTFVTPLNDVDLLLELVPSRRTKARNLRKHSKDTSCTLVEAVKTLVEEALREDAQKNLRPSYSLRLQGNSFGVSGGGLPQDVGFDLVPVRRRDDCYSVLDMRQQCWYQTYPNEAVERTKSAIDRHPRFLPMFRLLKAWIKQEQKKMNDSMFKIKSFHLEVICCSKFAGEFALDKTVEQDAALDNGQCFAKLLTHVSKYFVRKLKPPGGGRMFPRSLTCERFAKDKRIDRSRRNDDIMRNVGYFREHAKRANVAAYSAKEEQDHLWRDFLGDLCKA